ncbi:hypothetical protein BDQ17DRAFT_1353900 [Cyathus striatus]|nr:hypothetical protein BDQ17DRAFT_1353900 [Cyathus striatus]
MMVFCQQLGGIHGLPYIPWNGSVSQDGGYCVHGSVLFPTWHRPYMMLYEVYDFVMLEIAEEYTVDVDA